MSRVCFYCGKKTAAGRSIKRRGLAKKKGGVGKKITGITARVFYPNLHKVKAIVKGSVKTIKVCTDCITLGKIKKVI
ncbi:MAG: 50S ribosomal protein L28 [Candidatus Omnitrophota bacterium]